MYPQISPMVIPDESIRMARQLIESELLHLKNDYHPELSLADFKKKHIYPDSHFLLCLQARCFFKGLVSIVVGPELIKFVSKHLDEFNLFGAAFVRYHDIEMTSNGNDRIDNVVSSPLHYDEYGINTRTTWIPLQDISQATGSFCYSDDSRIKEMTGSGISPEQMHGSASNAFSSIEYIEALKNGIKLIECKAGQVVIFDRNVLHGSTYPCSITRVSLDIRWMESIGDKRSNSLFLINKNIKEFKKNALIGLYRRNDDKFIRRNGYFNYPIVHLEFLLRRNRYFLKFFKKIKSLLVSPS